MLLWLLCWVQCTACGLTHLDPQHMTWAETVVSDPSLHGQQEWVSWGQGPPAPGLWSSLGEAPAQRLCSV